MVEGGLTVAARFPLLPQVAPVVVVPEDPVTLRTVNRELTTQVAAVVAVVSVPTP